MQIPKNLSVSFLRDGFINATWKSSERISFSGCMRPFCNGSRRFQIQLQIFNSMPHQNRTLPALQTNWLKTDKRRDPFLVFENSAVTQERYYKFRLRNSNKTPQHSRDPDYHEDDAKITESGICHFGIHSKLKNMMHCMLSFKQEIFAIMLTLACFVQLFSFVFPKLDIVLLCSSYKQIICIKTFFYEL